MSPLCRINTLYAKLNPLRGFTTIAAAFFFTYSLCVAESSVVENEDFLNLSLAELGNIQVTSVAKKPQSLAESAAAIFVITQEDIRRSGVTTIPDALRMAPGVQVAKLNSSKWAISIRGFNDIFSNKLLVLVDGRTVYSPFFGGTYWDVQDTVLADIDQIEIIRGPGATLWGANAVNGVINIITKQSSETQGTLIRALAGNEERGTITMRYGGTFSPNSHFKVYGKAFERDAGADGSDDWRMGRLGFRIDSANHQTDTFTLQGDAYIGEEGDRATPLADIPPFKTFDSETDVAGGNILFRWNHKLAKDSEFTFQTYFDRTERKHFFIEDKRNTFDIDFQHRSSPIASNEILWGLGYRYISDDTNESSLLRLDPSADQYERFSAFVQDEITLLDDHLTFTLGSKFEHNDFTGFEYQPSARLLWKVKKNNVLWGAISRAIRTPSRIEQDVFLLRSPIAPGVALAIAGNDDMDSEQLIAYELGYRFFYDQRISLDIATFYNDYDDLRSLERGSIIPGNPVLVPLILDNKLDGESYGVEISGQWQVNDIWRLQAMYSYFQLQLHVDNGSTDVTEEGDENDSPHHQFALTSELNLTETLEFDTTIRFVDSIPKTAQKSDVDAYVTMDLRLGWQPVKSLDISLVGLNLFGNHREFRGSTVVTQPTDVEPSIFVRFDWTWNE